MKSKSRICRPLAEAKKTWDIWSTEVGDKVQYYLNGWRVGTLVELDLKTATIKPTGSGRNQVVPHDCVRGL